MASVNTGAEGRWRSWLLICGREAQRAQPCRERFELKVQVDSVGALVVVERVFETVPAPMVHMVCSVVGWMDGWLVSSFVRSFVCSFVCQSWFNAGWLATGQLASWRAREFWVMVLVAPCLPRRVPHASAALYGCASLAA
jgi:hypothetical protein